MDLEQIKALTALMVDNDLTEIMLRDGETRIVLRRRLPGGEPVAVAHHMPPMPVVAHAPVAVAPPARPAESAGGAADANGQTIKSPMVGTFYASPDPDSSPFVTVGSRVEPDTVVCIVEAMKVFNEIKAETSGVIERVLASNGQAVEFGQPLFQLASR